LAKQRILSCTSVKWLGLPEVSEVERKRFEESLEDGKAHEFLVDTIYQRMTARETRIMVLAAWKIQP
jgi:hypothetical protein